MDLVIDTNVMLACFKPDSVTRALMSIDALHLFTPENQIEELEKYMHEVASKYDTTEIFIEQIFYFLKDTVDIVPKDNFAYLIKKLDIEISDKKDLPVLALATAKHIQIWSNDLHLKEQSKISVFTTSELLDLIKRGVV